MKNPVLLLDLDGVLITTPPWKADEIHTDGYSAFNINCVNNLNVLLTELDFDIWLSSTRRTQKTITEFNRIFTNRGIIKPITGFVPVFQDCKNRIEELMRFLDENKISKFLIIDDDKSLNNLPDNMKQSLISTELLKGFDIEKLELSLQIIKRI